MAATPDANHLPALQESQVERKENCMTLCWQTRENPTSSDNARGLSSLIENLMYSSQVVHSTGIMLSTLCGCSISVTKSFLESFPATNPFISGFSQIRYDWTNPRVPILGQRERGRSLVERRSPHRLADCVLGQPGTFAATRLRNAVNAWTSPRSALAGHRSTAPRQARTLLREVLSPILRGSASPGESSASRAPGSQWTPHSHRLRAGLPKIKGGS